MSLRDLPTLCESCRTKVEPGVVGTVTARPQIDLTEGDERDAPVYVFHERCLPHSGRWHGRQLIDLTHGDRDHGSSSA